jgi:predicted nucleic acid-binding Zn ribbon protein
VTENTTQYLCQDTTQQQDAVDAIRDRQLAKDESLMTGLKRARPSEQHQLMPVAMCSGWWVDSVWK